jgi:putative ABC transport system permease protein
LITDLLADLRYSLRTLTRTPLLATTAISALTLGIGANTAIFSVVNTVLLTRLPYPDSDRIVEFTTQTPAGSYGGASPTKLNLWKEQSGVFEEVSAYRFRFANVKGGARDEQISVGEVSNDFFPLFGGSFERGRAFTVDEQRPRGGNVAIVSAGFARRYFGSSSDLLDKTISLDRELYTIVGVLDPAFDGRTLAGPAIGNPDVWLPLQLDPYSADQTNTLVCVARLRAVATLDAGQSQLQLATEQFRQKYPGIIGPKDTFRVESLRETMVRDARRSLLVLQGAVGFVLLTACANVASLLLMRSTARAREIAVKAALGASHGRIVRQLLTESLVLSTIGAVFGLTLGTLGLYTLLGLYPGNLSWIGPIGLGSIDKTVLGFTVLLTVVTAILAGLFPALHAAGFDLNTVLKQSSTHSGTGGGAQSHVRSVLVGAEIALALVLLVGAGLLARTFLALRAVNPGFDPRGVLTLRMSLDDPRLVNTAGLDQLIQNGVQRLSAVRGVSAVGASCCMPLENDMRLRLIIVGRPLEGAYHSMASWRSVWSGYFDALKIPLLRGRLFANRDRVGSPGVVIINQTMARQLWPDGDPLNDSILIGKGLGPKFATEPTRRIIGIVGDVRDGSLESDPRPTTYVPIAQLPDTVMEQTMRMLPLTWIVRISGSTRALGRAIQDELERSANVPVTKVNALSDVMRKATSDSNFYLTIMGVLAVAALLLAAIGLNGVMGFAVQQRTKEIGVRLALGAESAQIRNLILRDGLRLIVVSIAAGVGSAFLLTRFMAKFLFGVTEGDPLVFVGVPVVVLAASLVAVWLPARTIAKVDTMRALRSE